MGMFSTHLLHRERRYSPVGLLEAQRDIYLGGTHPLSGHSDPIQINQYRYDARYRLTGIIQSVPSATVGHPLRAKQTHAFHYDPSGRLTGSTLQTPTQNAVHHYAMDHEGNHIGSASYTGPASRTNRISEMDQAQLRYDDASNLIKKRTPDDLQTFEYDGLHRLSSVTRQRPGYPTTKTYYVYDALSRRIAKQVFPERCPSQLTRYGWDGDQLVHEDTGEQRTTVFYEPGSFAPLFRVDELGIDALEASGLTLEQFNDHNINTPRYSAFITDHLGTPSKLIDEDGHLLWSAQADDWAAVKDERTVPNLTQPIRFQGQWEDEETGLYYNRYRYYDPKQGRYITQDPIGLAGGLNSYAYVANPTGWVDPLGLRGGPYGQVAATRQQPKQIILPSLPMGNENNFGGFLWNRFLDGSVRDNIFDYGRGIVDGVKSVPNGWYNSGYQTARHLSDDPNAQQERAGIKVCAENIDPCIEAASIITKNQLSDINNYTSYNIGRAVGRTGTSLVARPWGALAVAGDIMESLNSGADKVRSILLGTN